MAEPRRRFRNKKRDDGRQQPSGLPTAQVTIARREDPRCSALIQPKILLKKEQPQPQQQPTPPALTDETELSNQENTASIKTIIINRSSEARNSSERCVPLTPASSSVCAALATKDKANGLVSSTQELLPPRMTRPTPLIVSHGVFNANARKLFHKTNTDFTAIGILGSQGVGKSTILNLLAMERSLDYDYYQHLFAHEADECIFPIRHKAKLQFFITKERYILMDTAPMNRSVCTDNVDLQSLSTICQLLSVCHVLILAMDEVNLEQLRLINAALRLRPHGACKGYVSQYLPQVIFVRTRSQRKDFEPQERQRWEQQLRQLYGQTGLHIYKGRGEGRSLNSLIMPEVVSNEATAYHKSLGELVGQLRERVFGAAKQTMCQANDFSETMWFELLAEVTRRGTQHFEKIYAEIKQRHLDPRHQWRNENWRGLKFEEI